MERWHHASHTTFINSFVGEIQGSLSCQRSNKHFILEMTGVMSELQHWLYVCPSDNKQREDSPCSLFSSPLLPFLYSSFPVGSCLLSILSACVCSLQLLFPFLLFHSPWSSCLLSSCLLSSSPLPISLPVVFFSFNTSHLIPLPLSPWSLLLFPFFWSVLSHLLSCPLVSLALFSSCFLSWPFLIPPAPSLSFHLISSPHLSCFPLPPHVIAVPLFHILLFPLLSSSCLFLSSHVSFLLWHPLNLKSGVKWASGTSLALRLLSQMYVGKSFACLITPSQ